METFCAIAMESSEALPRAPRYFWQDKGEMKKAAEAALVMDYLA